jgi:hypothetical protein
VYIASPNKFNTLVIELRSYCDVGTIISAQFVKILAPFFGVNFQINKTWNTKLKLENFTVFCDWFE